MKKIKLLGIIISVMFLWFVGQPLEAHADAYTWASNGETSSWYNAYYADETMKMDSAPTELTKNDSISIQAAPDDKCIEFLANLSGEIAGVSIGDVGNADIIVGKTDGTLKTFINVTGGNVTFYGKAQNVSISGNGNLTVYGNVDSMFLGNKMLDRTSATGTVVVNGNVDWLCWYKQRDEIEQNYESFMGNADITGTVGSGRIEEVYYDETIEQNVFVQTGEIGVCDEGIFRIINGVLSDTVSVTSKEVIFEYYHIYQCYADDFQNKNVWMKQYYNKSTGVYAIQKECNWEDIQEGAKIIIYSTYEPITFDMDLSRLQICSGEVTFNGDIVDGEVKLPPDGLSIGIPTDEEILNFKFTGNASNVSVNYNYNPNCNVFIGGKIDGTYWQNNTRQGYFECENVQLIKDGIWNENVLIKTSLDDDALSYEVVDEETVVEAVGDETIGQEVVDGETTIVKSVEAALKQTTQEVIDSIAETDDFKGVLDTIIEKMEETVEEVLDAKAICAVDISIDSFYREKETGNVYTANPTYGKENISELPEGNTLEFTVKVPKAHYKENAKYTIVRQHENADGSVLLEQLETMQNGDMLTFASDKFSTFVIVEIAEKIDTVITIKNVDDTVVKEDGIFGNGTFSLSDLIAGTYTFIATRENYVPRTYTVEVETDLETVELDVELHKTGDITGDETINARDKKMLFNHIAGTATLKDYDFAVGDVTGDGTLNARDKKMIYNHIAGTSSLWE